MPDRLVETLFEFVSIPSESGNEEGFLRHIGAMFAGEFRARCARDPYGNLVASIPARNSAASEALLLGFHADTVAPGVGIKPRLDGDVVRSDGTTVLGADDKAGLAELVEALRRAERFPPLEVVVTREEERGLLGSRNLDFSLLTARKGYVLDMDALESVVIGGPTKINLDVAVTGRAAHAGMEPEKGVSAIRAAAVAIAEIPDGRIDEFTTSNVGVIRGGENRNSVPERVEVQIEARSLDHGRCVALADSIRRSFEKAAAAMGAVATVKVSTAYRASAIGEGEEVAQIASAALRAVGIEPRLRRIVGGTDASAYNEHGIACAVLGTGVFREHTKDEYASVADMRRAVEVILELFRRFA